MKTYKNKKISENEEIYKVKYVFNNNSNVDVNDVIKECFMMQINKKEI